jgi:SAM-dependent methyltransferase
MEDWTAGYVADVGYTYGYYAELSPLYARFALAAAGLGMPRVETACELGFGQGVAINIHAAATKTQWWGTDFNPSQAAFARQIAGAAASGARLFDDSFEDFCRRPDVPEMDYIAMHGIWSWVSDANRAVLVDFVRRKLKPGGVLYMSYNTLPGWSGEMPLRELLVQAADALAAPNQGTVARIDAAIAFAQKFFETNPRYAKLHPLAVQRLKSMADQDRHYLAHEYFNRDWAPMSFANVAAQLGLAKMTFGATGNLVEHVDNVYFKPAQIGLIREVQDPVLQQTLRDFCVNQHFRKDYWVKGPRRLNAMQRREAIESIRVVLTRHPSGIKLTLPGTEPELKLADQVYMPIIEALSDHQPRSFGELRERVQGKGVDPVQLLQAVVVLAGKFDIQVAQSDEEIAAAQPAAARLNAHLMELARGDNSVLHLATPVTGGAVGVTRFHQMFMRAFAGGARKQDEWVKQAWRDLSAIGQRLTKNGATLGTPEENMAELGRHASEFAERLPMYQALKVV